MLRKRTGTIQQKILLNLLVVSLCGIVLSTAGFFAILTVVAQSSADETSDSCLNDVESRIDSNNQRLEELVEIVREDNLSRARALAMLIEMEPDIIEDAGKLQEIADALDVDEIHIIDEDGILRWGTQPYKYGMDFADGEQTRPFLAILDDPSIEISQDPMANASMGVIRQYAGVSLRNAKGIAEVGVIPTRLMDGIEETLIGNVLSDVKIGNTGYVFSISADTGLISAHPNSALIGARLPDQLLDSGFMEVDGEEIRYITRQVEDEILVAAYPSAEMYEQRLFSTGLFLSFTILLFGLFCAIINLRIKRTVVSGIYNVLGTLDRITDGELDATADVHSSVEFSRLSDGINHMLSSINAKISEVSEAVIAAEEASHAKTSFLANMSHEIRTPMNGIIGMTDLMLGEKLSERQLQYVRDIKTSAESLLGIINDILDLSKISEGRLQITPVDIDLSTLLKNAVSLMGFSARSKGLEFVDDIRIDSPEYVRTDDVRLNQIILNILSNAVKFTKKGHVKLLAKIEDDSIMLEISDTGIGIRQEEIALIFVAFEQADTRRNRAIKGTGLGLSITKNLVELMGGTIWVESEYGVGTTFHVTIPYVPGDESAVEIVDTEFKYISAPTAQVLLVDDIRTNLTVGAGLLRMCGITADVALSGHEAIELVKAKDYDIVFMDHMMPEMDGVEAMTAIREMGGKCVELPIIALTANAVNESRDFLLASGMNDFLSKPIDKAALMNILQKWLPPHKIEPGLKSDASVRTAERTETLAAAANIEGLDIELALSRISGQQDILEASIKQAAYSLEGHLGKMDSFLCDGDLHGFSIEAHGLKGTLANIGATRHSELVAELEIASKAENMPLCINKFAGVADIMGVFAKELKAVFKQTEAGDKPRGDSELLTLSVSEAIDSLNNFEAADALKCIDKLMQFAFNEETDSILGETKTAAEAFDYERAALLLSSIKTSSQ